MSLTVLLVAEHDSQLAARIVLWGAEVRVIPATDWLAGKAPDLVTVFNLQNLSPGLVERAVERVQMSGVPAVWVTDRELPASLGASGSSLVFWAGSPDSLGAWTLGQADRLRKNRAETKSFQDLAGGLTIGLFRFRASHELSITLEYFNARSEELTGITFAEFGANPLVLYERLIPEDREPFRQFMASLRSDPRTDETRIHMKVAHKVHTLRARFDVPLPTKQGYIYQGMIEDVTEDVRRRQYGERAVELLWQLKENLNFLDVIEPQFGSDALLSPRERDVYQLLRVGMSNAVIASRLGCKESTVKKHVSAIFDKKGVNSRAQLLSLDQ